MPAMEYTPTTDSELSGEKRHGLAPTDTLRSEKLDDLRTEAESILEAIEVSSSSSSVRGNTGRDLEKASTVEADSAHGPATRTVTAQDWSGPDDPENPQNWSLLKRCMHVFPIAFLAFAVTASSSIITPSTPEIAEHFHVSRTAAILSLSLFVLGLGIGPALAAPISETFGRSVVYKGSGPIYMLFILGAGFSKTFGGFLVCRLLAGMSGGPVLAVGAGTIADQFPPRIRAIASIFYVTAPFLGPALGECMMWRVWCSSGNTDISPGPVIGGFVAQYKGYKWTQWVTIFIAIAAYVFILPMQETYKKIILKKRAKRLGVDPPAAATQIRGLAYIKLLVTVTLVRPVHMLFSEPIVLFFSAYNAFAFSVLFAFFAAYPFTFETVYGFNTWQYGLTFLGIGIGVCLATVTGIVIDRKMYMAKHREALKEGRTVVAPEHRLYVGMLGAFGIPVG